MRRKSWGIYIILFVIVGICIYLLSRASKNRENFSDSANYDIVVAQYNEDVSWLLPYARHIKLYIKSGEKNESAIKLEKSGAHIFMLPNVGREAHTYLRYIIDNYDNLPDYVVFTQGSIHEHYDMNTFESIVNLGDNSKSLNYNTNNHTDSKNRDWRIQTYGNNTSLISANMTLGDFFDKYIKRDISGLNYPVYWAAIFSVKSSEIKKRSKLEYEEMIKPLEVGNSTEIAHFFERSWYYIFS